MDKEILENVDLAKAGVNSNWMGDDWSYYVFQCYAMKKDKRLWHYNKEILDKSVKDEILQYFNNEFGISRIYLEDSRACTFKFLRNDTYVSISISNTSDHLGISLSTFNNCVYDNVKEFLNSIKIKERSGIANVITQSNGEYDLTEIGVAGINLEKDNYEEEVVKDYQHIIEDLKSPNPCGRIILLDGPPGCGKTYAIRGIINDVQHVKFLIIPSEMVQGLSGPGLMKFLIENHAKDVKTTVLIIEDADQCLDARRDIASISSLLNLGDGIIGNLLDLRMILTTNVPIEKIDEAILRPGRLCKRIEFNELSGERAAKVYSRLTQKDAPEIVTSNDWTLAEIYKFAKSGEVPPHKGKKMGFGR